MKPTAESNNQNDLLEKAAASTRAISETMEYRKWLNNLYWACKKVDELQSARHVPKGAMSQALVDMMIHATVKLTQCDKWLDAAQIEHDKLMIEVMEK